MQYDFAERLQNNDSFFIARVVLCCISMSLQAENYLGLKPVLSKLTVIYFEISGFEFTPIDRQIYYTLLLCLSMMEKFFFSISLNYISCVSCQTEW